MTAEREVAVTIVTDLTAGGALSETAASIVSQSLGSWEWKIVTTGDSVAAPIDDPRVRVVAAQSRVDALKAATDDAAEFVAVVDPEAVLEPTALEKWLWFLEVEPACGGVAASAAPLKPKGPRMIRRSLIERTQSLDAALALATGTLGLVPMPTVDGSYDGRRAPRAAQTPNEWLPEHRPVRNILPLADRRLLVIGPWMKVGGSDKVTLDLLDRLHDHGWQATVATTLEAEHDWLPLYARRTADIFPLGHFLRLADFPRFLTYLIDSRRPDVVLISNSELAYRLLPYLRSRCPGAPFVDFCHSEAEHWNHGGYPRFSVEYSDQLDLTITASAHLRRWMVERGGDPDRIEVSHANVDAQACQPQPGARGAVRAELSISDDEPILLFAGRVSEDKQPPVFGATIAKLAASDARFTAIVAGEGPELAWLHAYVGRNHLSARIRLVGAVRHERMIELMSAADLFFLPSRSEGIALTLYEAMACGVPVVAAAVGGQAELVTPECGILVERGTPEEEADRYAAALGGLLRDEPRRREMGARSRQRIVEHFDLPQMGDRMNGLLERAIDLHATAPHPAPAPGLARATATGAIELTRLAHLGEWMWSERRERLLRRRGVRGVLAWRYYVAREVAAPIYRRGLDRGWTWLPRLKDVIERVFVGDNP